MPILAGNDLLTPAVILSIYCSVYRIYLTRQQRTAREPEDKTLLWRILALSVTDALFLGTALLSLAHYALGSEAGLSRFLIEAARWLFGFGLLCVFLLHLTDWRRCYCLFKNAGSDVPFGH